MNIEEIFEEWEKDSQLSPTSLDREALAIPSLHHKYYRMLSGERMRLKKAEADLAILRKLKGDYYSGTIDADTLRERGWKPFRLRVLKTDLNTYLDADEEVIQSSLRISMMKEKVELLDSIIRTIGNRGFHITAAINFMKYKAGEF